MLLKNKGLPIKDVRSQGVLSTADILRTRGERVFSWCKISGFFEIYGVLAWTSWVQPVQIFCGQGGSDFLLFRADGFFYGRFLFKRSRAKCKFS